MNFSLIAFMAESSYKDKDYNLHVNTTVSEENIIDNLKTLTPLNAATTKKAYQFPIEPMIGERITERLKNYI